MQSITSILNRQNSQNDIRKFVLNNTFLNNNNNSDIQISSSASTSSASNNDTLSPNIITNVNPFEEQYRKIIQEQANNQNTQRSSSVKYEILNRTQQTLNRTLTTPQEQLIPLNNSINLKKSNTIGKYMLFDVLTTNTQQQQQQQQQSSSTTQQNDLMYNIALNLNDKKSYYWKKIPMCDYTKKLQPYLLLDSSEHVYRFHEVINDGRDTYLFFQPHHGDLHSYMKDKKRLKESEAKSLFYQIVEVVRECHENGIIVRDIKLKKFVFADAEKKKILLTNLEDCLVLEDPCNDLIKSQQGCPAYVSPEVLNPIQTYYSGKLSDSWSLGIVLYTLLFGRYPFHHNTITTMFAKIAKGKFQIPTNGISLDAKILLRSLIRLNANERLLPDEIIKTNWFKDFSFIDYKNIYEINKVINDTKINRTNLTQNNNETTNYQEFFGLIENNNNNINNNRILNNSDDQSVPHF